MKVDVDSSELEKLSDVLAREVEFHQSRDRMNAALHLAGETRYSPLTSEVMAARDRVDRLLGRLTG